MLRTCLLQTYLPHVQVHQICSSSREVHANWPLQARNSPEISGETSRGHGPLVAGRTLHEAMDDDDEDVALLVRRAANTPNRLGMKGITYNSSKKKFVRKKSIEDMECFKCGKL